MDTLRRGIRGEWPLVVEMIVFGLFAAGDFSGALNTTTGITIGAGWVILIAIVVIGGTALVRLSRLHDEISDLREDTRLTAQLGSIAQNFPDPGADKMSLRVRVFWEIWTDRDVIATDKIAVNLFYGFDRPWWRFWEPRRVGQRGIPREGHTTEYREKIYNNMLMPFKDQAEFAFVEDRHPLGDEVHWFLELVLILGVPKRRLSVPLEIDLDRPNMPHRRSIKRC